jgi:hypothetical protein
MQSWYVGGGWFVLDKMLVSGVPVATLFGKMLKSDGSLNWDSEISGKSNII